MTLCEKAMTNMIHGPSTKTQQRGTADDGQTPFRQNAHIDGWLWLKGDAAATVTNGRGGEASSRLAEMLT